MSKEIFIKLCEKLGRDPTDAEMTDEWTRIIDGMESWELPDRITMTKEDS